MSAPAAGPALAVVIPAFNAERTLPAAVSSARAAGADEVVVVDDGSADRTADVAAGLGCVVVRQANAGAAAARRAGVRRTGADAVVLLDADDELVPEGVRRSLELLRASGDEVVAAGGAAAYVAGAGAGTVFGSRRRVVTLDDLLEDGFAPVPPAALVWRRNSLAEAMFGPTPALWPANAEDYELLVRGGLAGVIAFHDEVAARYQTVGGKSSTDPMRSIVASERIRRHYAAEAGRPAAPRGLRHMHSRVMLRQAAELRVAGDGRLPYLGAVARAAASDPGLVTRMAGRKLRSSVVRRVRGPRVRGSAVRAVAEAPLLVVAHPSPDVYGSDLQMLETVSAALGAGWRVTVVLPQDGPLRPRVEERGADVEIVPFPVLRRSVLSARGVARLAAVSAPGGARLLGLLRRLRPACVLVNTLTVPLWVAVARTAGCAVVCHVHEAEEFLPRPVRLALGLPLTLADAVVANSEATRKVLLGVLPRLASRTTVIHNGVPDAGPPRPLRSRAPDDPLSVAFVGRISRRKGVLEALEAVAHLRRSGRQVRLDVCGSAYPGSEEFEREVRSRAAEPDLRDSVVLRGYVPEPRRVLEEADAVIVPSAGESFGNTAVEGMLAGRPVIASRAQGLAEILDDAPRTGLLVEPGNVGELAEALAAVAQDPELARSMAAEGRREALERFSVDTYRRRFAALLAQHR